MSTIVLAHEPFYRRPPTRLLRAHAGRILVVGDDPATAGAIARALAGCYVHTAWNSREALSTLATAEPFEGLFCDLSVSELSSAAGAPALYEVLLRRHAALAEHMVFVVDAGLSVRQHWFLGALENPILEKPIDPLGVAELAWGVDAHAHRAPSLTNGAGHSASLLNGAGKR